MKAKNNISSDLQNLVSWSVASLGQAIELEYGKKVFQRVEKIRKQMKSIRKKNPDIVYDVLKNELAKLKKYNTKEINEICSSFSLMLELINRCESAYRTFKLDNKEYSFPKQKPYGIIFVLTAHPTEARSPELLGLFENIQRILKSVLYEGQVKYEEELLHYLVLALKISLARNTKPTVSDEAKNIYSFILQDSILNSLGFLVENGVNVSLRTWVGGDKDGHPGVNEVTMLESLSQSRERIINFLDMKLTGVEEKILYLPENKYSKILEQIAFLKFQLSSMRHIKSADGKKVEKFRKLIKKFIDDYEKTFKILSPELRRIESMIWLFPALVVALEVREDSSVVKEALESSSQLAIHRMLVKLKDISKGYDSKWYIRGFVMSMVESATDLENGLKLELKVFKKLQIPVVPLFENQLALTQAKKILTDFLNSYPEVVKTHHEKWGGRFEMMVGYSDSSKENGVLSSRLMISTALKTMESTLKKYKLTPVFFHGSGGSIERGGGSIKEQTSWWPKSAIMTYKATVQGEMVARNFGTPQIFQKQVSVILDQLTSHNSQSAKHSPELLEFTSRVRDKYSAQIQDDEFLQVIEFATPYSFLHHLKIGSRPAKRSTKTSHTNLRAIPWILCWTQTRTLFPTWWGTGSAWKSMSQKQKDVIQNEYQSNNVLSSYMKALGFTLAKIELGVWRVYLENSKLPQSTKDKIFKEFKNEFKLTKKFFHEVTGEKQFLWFRPWLQQSIDLRSSMIHPINLCQMEALRREDIDLLRMSVTGVACGMLTTG